MLSGEQLLEQAAKDGSMVPDEWPRALEIVLSKLEHIVFNEFPMPTLPPPADIDKDGSATPSKPEVGLSQETQTADKENAPPPGTTTTSVAAGRNTPTPQTSAQQDAAAPGDAASSQLPPELASLYTTITTALRHQFPNSPPHTLQRLSELVLTPRTHYRHLPPYLRALDRIISVSSTTTVFPLPQTAIPSSSSTGILNGVSTSSSPSLGSDESLGGALLTPIPWLQQQAAAREPRSGSANSAGSANNNSELVSESTEMVDGPNGAGRIETVSVINGVLGTTTTTAGTGPGTAATTAAPNVPAPSAEALREAGAVTQGELLRQEQEAGVVPVGQTTNPRRSALLAGGGAGGGAAATVEAGEQKEGEKGDGEEQQEEVPHARGPEEVGVEDMGPQDRAPGEGLNLEAAVGRAPVAAPSTAEGEGGKAKAEESVSPETEMKDVDDEAAAAKVDGKEGEKDGKEEQGGEDVAEEAKKKRVKDEEGEGADEDGGKKKRKRKKRTTAAARNKAEAKSDTEMTD